MLSTCYTRIFSYFWIIKRSTSIDYPYGTDIKLNPATATAVIQGAGSALAAYGYYRTARTGYRVAKRVGKTVMQGVKRLGRKRARITSKQRMVMQQVAAGKRPYMPSSITKSLGAEMNFADTYRLAGLTVGDTWTNLTPQGGEGSLSAIAQGDTQITRTGKRATLKSIELFICIKQSAMTDLADAPPPRHISIALVWNKRTNATVNDASEVYDTVVAGLEWMGCRDELYANKYKVLKRWNIQVKPIPGHNDGDATGTYNFEQPILHYYAKLPDIVVNFTGAAALIANIEDNNLFLIACSDSDATGVVNYRSRVRFVG